MDEVSALMCDRWQIAKLAKLGLLHRCRRRVGPDGSAFRRTVSSLEATDMSGSIRVIMLNFGSSGMLSVLDICGNVTS